MKVILRKDIRKLGKCGDVVKVKDGYARNYLFPQGLVLKATDGNLKRIEKEKALLEKQSEERKAQALELAKKLEGFSCTIAAEASEDDSLYGSISVADIAESCQAEGIEIDKNNIVLKDSIKKLGVYSAEAQLHPEVKQEIKIWVVRK